LITWIPNIDLAKPTVGIDLAGALKGKAIDTLIITAGYFATEDFGNAKWDEQIKMYTISSVAPVFVVQELVKSSILHEGSKVVLVSSESGSITLRHEQEGGGNFGHHGSKAALNMVAKQLSFDLKGKGIAVVALHPR
jgi:short-subunit dehydrogenase